jgi:hypothetical protein
MFGRKEKIEEAVKGSLPWDKKKKGKKSKKKVKGKKKVKKARKPLTDEQYFAG